MKKKRRKNLAITIFIIAIILIFFTLSDSLEKQTPAKEKQIPPEKKEIQEWLLTWPTVTIEGNEKRPFSAEWVEPTREYLLYDENNQTIGYITYNELMLAKKTGAVPDATKQSKSQPPTKEPMPEPEPVPTEPAPTGLEAHCTNNQWDGDESDIDCGGSCNPCPPPGKPEHKSCWVNTDCKTGKCDLGKAQQRLPATDPISGKKYYSPLELQKMAGETWMLPWQGKCV